MDSNEATPHSKVCLLDLYLTASASSSNHFNSSLFVFKIGNFTRYPSDLCSISLTRLHEGSSSWCCLNCWLIFLPETPSLFVLKDVYVETEKNWKDNETSSTFCITNIVFDKQHKAHHQSNKKDLVYMCRMASWWPQNQMNYWLIRKRQSSFHSFFIF